eukprot:4722662-Pyramimonas_sp.AAC.1
MPDLTLGPRASRPTPSIPPSPEIGGERGGSHFPEVRRGGPSQKSRKSRALLKVFWAFPEDTESFSAPFQRPRYLVIYRANAFTSFFT